MDCTDIVVGSAIGDMSRIGDFYTVSRATPRQDSFYGGEDSLTAAVGWEENGVTTLMFRKPLKGETLTVLDGDELAVKSFSNCQPPTAPIIQSPMATCR